jgi:hypothetical protein
MGIMSVSLDLYHDPILRIYARPTAVYGTIRDDNTILDMMSSRLQKGEIDLIESVIERVATSAPIDPSGPVPDARTGPSSWVGAWPHRSAIASVRVTRDTIALTA